MQVAQGNPKHGLSWMVFSAFSKSLLWIAAFVALEVAASAITSLIVIDFIHGNPHRSLSNAVTMMIFQTPLIAFVYFVLSLVVTAPVNLFQATTVHIFQLRGWHPYLALLLFMPPTAVVAWYSYDYLTPSNVNLGINELADWQPYQHGITNERLLLAFAGLVPITLFNFAYYKSRRAMMKRRIVLLSAFCFVIGVSAIHGIKLGADQFKHLN